MKIDRLIEKTTENDEAKKWKVVVGIVVGLVLACGLFCGCYYIILAPFVDSYIADKPISHLYDFYDLNIGNDETAIYFIGNSQIGADVYIPLVQKELDERGYSELRVYNIYRDSDNPIRRLSQIEDIVESKPSLVIYGVSSWILTTDDGWVDEDVILVKERLNLNSSADYLYSQDELDDLYSETSNPMYMKKFLSGAITSQVSKILSGRSQVIDPITYTTNVTWEPWENGEKRTRYSNTFGINGQDLLEYVELTETYANTSRNKISLYPFVGEETRKLLAFEYMLERFDDEGIPVVLVIMPEHSILNENTPAVSETNLRNYVDNTGLSWYDLDEMYGDEIMADLTHVHWDGAVTLAPVWADIVIQEMS